MIILCILVHVPKRMGEFDVTWNSAITLNCKKLVYEEVSYVVLLDF